MKKEVFAVKGMTCSACVAHVERAARAALGEDRPISVSLLSSTVSVTAEDGESTEMIYKKLSVALRRAGYGLAENDPAAREAREKREKKTELIRLILGLFLTALLMAVAMWHMTGLPTPAFLDGEKHPRLFFSIQAVLTAAVLVLERRFFRSGFSALLHGTPNMDSLVALGSAASVIYGLFAGIYIFYGAATGDHAAVHRYLHELYLESAAMILVLVSLGKYLESRAKHRAAGAVRALVAEEPLTARLVQDGGITEIPLSDLQVGDLVFVPMGEKIPADGTVFEGNGSINEAMLTGESLPRFVKEGEKVSGATVLVEGSLTVKVDRVGEETTLRRIAALLEETAATKAPVARLADKVSAVFVPVVLVISLITAAVWLIAARDAAAAFRAAVSVLVISCPCALGLATPTAITVGSGRAARFGILFKSAEALETLAGVKCLLTDKTGTLTEGKMAVTDNILLNGTEKDLLLIAASLESLSAHPLAAPLAALTEERIIIEKFDTVAGLGVIGCLQDGTRVMAGSKGLLIAEAQGPRIPHEAEKFVEKAATEGKSVVLVAKGDTVLGAFAVADTLRADSAAAVAKLKTMGVKTVMLTGDTAGAAEKIAAEAGISELHAGLLPADKERLAREYAAKGLVAMVGDGINDAPALARADVGLAIGAGTGVAVESASVVLAGNSLSDVVSALELGRATLRNIRQNLFWALAYNSLCIPLAAGVFYPVFRLMLTPMIASAAMSCSSIFVVLNALRLGKFTPSPHKSQKTEKKEIKKENEDMFFKKAETKTVVLSVEGMMCSHCTARVESVLSAVKGVVSAKADLEAKTVTVVAEEKVKESLLKDTVIGAGYKVL